MELSLYFLESNFSLHAPPHRCPHPPTQHWGTHSMHSTGPLAQSALRERKIRAAGRKEDDFQVTGLPGCTHFPPVLLPWAQHTAPRLSAAQLVSRYIQGSEETDLQQNFHFWVSRQLFLFYKNSLLARDWLQALKSMYFNKLFLPVKLNVTFLRRSLGHVSLCQRILPAQIQLRQQLACPPKEQISMYLNVYE